MAPPALQRMIEDPPKLHVHPRGMLISGWRPDDVTIAQLDRRLKPGMATLETGAGFSTILFAIYGCRHTAIAPDGELFQRIRRYCRENDISLENVELVEAGSTDIVPHLAPDSVDLAMIDGCHGFPTVMVDFLYMTRALRKGGTLIVDDLNIFPCQMVGRFIQSDPAWRVEVFTNQVAFGVKLDETGSVFREWHMQPFVRRRSTATSLRAKIATALGFY
jgi:hypothetical protein